MEKKIGFIGGGAMAEAILSGAVSKQVLAAENIFVSDHKEERCRFLQDSYGVQAFVGAEGFLSDVDILLLASSPRLQPRRWQRCRAS